MWTLFTVLVGIALIPAGILILGLGSMLVWWLIAPFPKKWETEHGLDTSNRINRVRLLWWLVTKPYLMVPSFEWLKRDEQENMDEYYPE